MENKCPECGRKLNKRGRNILQNIKRRSLGSPFDRYVCHNCDETFRSREVIKKGDVECWHE